MVADRLDHRIYGQPGADLVVRKIFEKLLDRADAGLMDKDDTLAAVFGRPDRKSTRLNSSHW